MKTPMPIYKMGTCESCNRLENLVAVFGLVLNHYNYLCTKCLDDYATLSPFGVCENCKCFLNKVKLYPTDSAKKDQKTYCLLCYEFKNIEDFAWNNTPKKERPALLKAIKKMEAKEK